MSIIFNKIYSSCIDQVVIQIIIIKEFKYKIILNYGTYYMDFLNIYQTNEIKYLNHIPDYLLSLFDLIFNFHSNFQYIFYQLNSSLKNYSKEDFKNIKIRKTTNITIKKTNLINENII